MLVEIKNIQTQTILNIDFEKHLFKEHVIS